MDTIETRLENVENNVKSLEMLINGIYRHEDHVMSLHAQVVEMLKDQKQHLLMHDEHLDKLDRLLEHQQRQMEHQQQQLDSMQRFNVQTRQMWIAVARKVDLDYEDPELDS